MKSEFEAQGFHPSFKGRTANGQLQINANELLFTSSLGTFSIPVQGLAFRTGGYNNSQIFFENPAAPGCSIATTDGAIKEHPIFSNNPDFKRQINQAKKSDVLGRRVLYAVGLVFLLFFAGILAIIIKRDAIIRFIADKIPQTWELNLGNSIFDQVKAEQGVIRDARAEAILEDISKRLLPEVKDSGYTFEFHVVSNTNINAFAIPGGHVVVFTGLLDAAKTPEQIAGVLAHEIAHVTQKHGFRKIIESGGLFLLVQALFGDVTGILAVITEGSRFLLQQKFSRDFEREADDAGWNYLLAAKIHPRGMIEFFETLKAQENAMVSTLSLINTHPATEERIAYLENKWKKLDAKEGFIPLKAFPGK